VEDLTRSPEDGGLRWEAKFIDTAFRMGTASDGNVAGAGRATEGNGNRKVTKKPIRRFGGGGQTATSRKGKNKSEANQHENSGRDPTREMNGPKVAGSGGSLISEIARVRGGLLSAGEYQEESLQKSRGR